jgi:hypothetical protein
LEGDDFMATFYQVAWCYAWWQCISFSTLFLLWWHTHWIYSSQYYREVRSLYFTTIAQIKLIQPAKGASLEALVIQHKAFPVPEQQLHPVSTTTEENKQVTARWIHAEV